MDFVNNVQNNELLSEKKIVFTKGMCLLISVNSSKNSGENSTVE